MLFDDSHHHGGAHKSPINVEPYLKNVDERTPAFPVSKLAVPKHLHSVEMQMILPGMSFDLR